MMANIKRDTRENVIEYLEEGGLQIEDRIDSAYADAVMIVQARKPAPEVVCSVRRPLRNGIKYSSATAMTTRNGSNGCRSF